MPQVTCSGCGTETHVRFTRGARLASVACPGCGKHTLHMPRAGRPEGAGFRYEDCVICGARKKHPLHPPFEFTRKYPTDDEEADRYPAGSPCCSAHEPVPAGRARWAAVLAAAGIGRREHWTFPAPPVLAELVAAAAPVPGCCPVCASVDWPGTFQDPEGTAYLTATVAVLVAVCWRCNHTILLAKIARAPASGPAATEAADSQARGRSGCRHLR
jgi:hypothetical protein